MDPGAENAAAAPPRGRVYRGNPKNQKDPRVANAWQAPQPKGPLGRNPKPTPDTAPAAIPPPSKRHDASKAPISEQHPSETSLFANNMAVRESVPRFLPVNTGAH